MPFISIKGVRYHYLTTTQPVETPELIIVFIHGAGGNSSHWICQMSGLRRKFTCFAVDLPGHGLSEGHAQTSINAYREFIKDFTDQLVDKPFFLCGHSMGGAITIDFAKHYPERLHGQILVGTGSRLRVLPVILGTFGKGEHFTELINYAYGKYTPQPVLERAVREMLNTSPSVFWADFMACDAFDISEYLPSIKVPALVITAKDDKLTPPKYGKYLAANLPYTTLKNIPQAGHMMMLEQPEQVNYAIENFIKERGNTNASQS